MEKTILIIEDEVRIRRLISDYLKKENYKILEAGDGEEGLEVFLGNNIDLIIVDIMMPNLNGWEVTRAVREEDHEIPLIMLTAKSEEYDQLKGYKLGVDEYVTKPFSPKILVAKVGALLKRTGMSSNEISFGDIKIDLTSHRVYKDNEELMLTPKEFDLLIFFNDNKGIALTRERILDKIWGYDYFGDLRTVDTHIKRLRKKIGEPYIETVRGIGYRFTGE